MNIRMALFFMTAGMLSIGTCKSAVQKPTADEIAKQKIEAVTGLHQEQQILFLACRLYYQIKSLDIQIHPVQNEQEEIAKREAQNAVNAAFTQADEQLTIVNITDAARAVDQAGDEAAASVTYNKNLQRRIEYKDLFMILFEKDQSNYENARRDAPLAEKAIPADMQDAGKKFKDIYNTLTAGKFLYP